jgi:ubiquinone biosynthesis protein Coq4
VTKPQFGGPMHLIRGLENDIIDEISVQRVIPATLNIIRLFMYLSGMFFQKLWVHFELKINK